MDHAGSSPAAGTSGARETYNAYMRDYLKRRYRERHLWAIDRLGGICAQCGSTNNLEIDHMDKSQKLFQISQLLYKRSLSSQLLLDELEKCQVLCDDCHRKKSGSEMSVDHGGGLTGKKNCKCGPCRTRKAKYASSRGYNQNRCRKKNCFCEKKHYAA